MWTPRRNCITRSAGIFEQEAVPGVLHDPAAVIENDRVYRASVRLERGMRSRLVDTHHARVAGDVSADYGGQTSVHLLRILFIRQPAY
jgi:hypothetical protein